MKKNYSHNVNRILKHIPSINFHCQNTEQAPTQFMWQKTFYAQLLNTDTQYLSHYSYIETNHFKHGFTEEYPLAMGNYLDLLDTIL